MIEWISNWASSIIVAVIIGTILEMILPNGSSRKYIKMVIGVYILFTIVSPLISKFTDSNIDISEELGIDTYLEEMETNSKTYNELDLNSQDNIMEIYLSGIKEDIKNKVEKKGYIVKDINVNVSNDDTYTINYIELKVEKEDNDENDEEKSNNTNSININRVESVETVNINSNNTKENNADNLEENNNLSKKEIKELKEYLSSEYEVDEDNIVIN